MSLLVANQRLASARKRVLALVEPRNWRTLGWLAAGDAKYGEPFWIAEELKIIARRWYLAAAPPTPDEPYEMIVARAREFWAAYEEINRVWLPDDPVYTGTRAGVALSTTADFWTLTSGASGQDRVLEVNIGGEATASAVARVALQASTSGATPTNQTPEKLNTRSPAAASTFATTWTTQPTLSGNPWGIQVFNAFGGTDRWVAPPGSEFYLVNGEKMSARSQSGTSTCSGHVFFEEL